MRRLGALLAVLLVLVGTLTTAAVAAAVHRTNVRPGYGGDGLLVILAIGSDIGPPHRPGNPLRGRSDGVHLIAVDPGNRRATVVDIPRDTLVGGRKLSEQLYHQGPDALAATVTQFTGVNIDYWALMTFRSIENVVDGLDGVQVHVEHPMRDRFSGSNFAPGPQRLRGHQALAFVRDRKSVPGGDFGRSRNHGNLLRAAHAQIRAEASDLPGLTRLIGLFSRNTVTNIPSTQLLPMALLAVQIDPAHVRQDALQGAIGVGAGGASVVHLRPGAAFERIRAGHVGP